MNKLVRKFIEDPLIQSLLSQERYEEVSLKAASLGTASKNQELRTFSANLLKQPNVTFKVVQEAQT